MKKRTFKEEQEASHIRQILFQRKYVKNMLDFSRGGRENEYEFLEVIMYLCVAHHVLLLLSMTIIPQTYESESL